MKNYRVDVFVHDEFFGDENNITHVRKEFETLEECYIFAEGWKFADNIFILKKIIDDKYDIIEQIA